MKLQEQLLSDDRRQQELAEQVPELNIVERCRCGDDLLRDDYTQLREETHKLLNLNHRSGLTVSQKTGLIILDVIEGKIDRYRNP